MFVIRFEVMIIGKTKPFNSVDTDNNCYRHTGSLAIVLQLFIHFSS